MCDAFPAEADDVLLRWLSIVFEEPMRSGDGVGGKDPKGAKGYAAGTLFSPSSNMGMKNKSRTNCTQQWTSSENASAGPISPQQTLQTLDRDSFEILRRQTKRQKL